MKNLILANHWCNQKYPNIMSLCSPINYRPPTKLQESNVFSGVCPSVFLSLGGPCTGNWPWSSYPLYIDPPPPCMAYPPIDISKLDLTVQSLPAHLSQRRSNLFTMKHGLWRLFILRIFRFSVGLVTWLMQNGRTIHFIYHGDQQQICTDRGWKAINRRMLLSCMLS